MCPARRSHKLRCQGAGRFLRRGPHFVLSGATLYPITAERKGRAKLDNVSPARGCRASLPWGVPGRRAASLDPPRMRTYVRVRARGQGREDEPRMDRGMQHLPLAGSRPQDRGSGSQGRRRARTGPEQAGDGAVDAVSASVPRCLTRGVTWRVLCAYGTDRATRLALRSHRPLSR